MQYRHAALGAAVLLTVASCAGQEPAHDSIDGAIVFSSSRDGDFEILVMDADGGAVRQLTQNASRGANEADDYAPAWSPDGSRVAFTSTRDHDGDGFESQELYVMAADGSGQTRLTENRIGEGEPSWSSNGDSLLYARPRPSGEDTFELALMTSDGAQVRPLIEIDGYGSGAFSPDGARLAFTRCGSDGDEPDCEIWVARADGDDAHVLVDSQGRDSGPAWSPDGTRIAFTSDRDRNGDCFFHDCWGHNGEIYVMDADGSDQARVTNDPGDDGSPTWSPDGSRIAFAGLRNVDGAVDTPDENYEIYVMDADGSGLRRLTNNTAWDWQPDWSGARGRA
jgi:Tol biopolymer transport system component